jgi:hypothetical protein
VLDLRIASGEVEALVSGSRLYQVKVRVSAVPPRTWSSICRDCVGGIDSLVELLQGRFSKAVMERICREGTGLFPAPAEIKFSCTCPDWASMCKHVAAVLYGTGARLDLQPELLFKLRKVHERDLIAKAGATAPLSKSGAAPDRVLRSDGLAEIFGLEMATGGAGGEEASEPAPARGSRGAKLRGSTGKAPRPSGKAKPKEVRSSGPKSGKKRCRAR